MTHSDYDALPGVRWSYLKEMGRSPAHYRYAVDHPREDTAALRLGRAVHLAVLQPELFGDSYTTWQGTRRGKDWDIFRLSAEARGVEVLTADEVALCLALQTAVRSDPVAGPLLRVGSAEAPVQWTDPAGGVACKALIDFRDDCFIDLKTTRDASPGGFGREVVRYGYAGQMAFYRRGLAETGRPACPVKISAV